MAVTLQTLENLYTQGKLVDVSPEKDGSVEVWIRRLGPKHHQTAVRKANAERIKFKSLPRDNEDVLPVVEEVSKMSREDRIDLLIEIEVAPDKEKIEQELSEEEEWSKDDKLQGLMDAWNDGLLEEWLKGEGKRSEESEHVFNEMNRFTEQVNEKVEGRRKSARRQFEDMSDDELFDKVFEILIDREAGLLWLRVFREHQILFGVCEPETKKQMMEDVEEVQNLPIELWQIFLAAFEDLALTAKDVKS